MGKNERKMTLSGSKTQIAEALKDLADLMTGVNDTIGDDSDISDDFHKLKITIEKKEQVYYLKVKVKSNDRDSGIFRDISDNLMEPVRGKLPKYRALKGRMKSTFKKITQRLSEGLMPFESDVALFLADSKRMVVYPGNGDAYYDRYLKACDVFRQAFEAKDLSACRENAEAIDHLKTQCHREYK